MRCIPPSFTVAVLVAYCAPSGTAQDSRPSAPGWEQQLEKATKLFQSGDPQAAIAAARKAVEMTESFGEGDERVAKSLLTLSSLLIVQRQFDEAEELSVRAHRIYEDQLATARTRVATTLKYLGAIYSQQGKLDEAERVYVRAVQISEESVGADHPETAKHVGNLGSLHLRRGQMDEAHALFLRALEIWDAQPEPNPVYTVGVMRNLAELHLQQGRMDEGVALYAKGVAIQQKAFGASDPRLKNTLKGYASALRRAGREDKAAEIEKQLADGGGK